LASYPLSFVRIWFYWTLLVLHEEPLFGLPVVLSISASAECELNLSSKQHNNNNSQVHSGLPANFHCFVLPSYSVRSQLFLCLSCLDPSIVRTWADLVEDGGVLGKQDCSRPPQGRPSLLAGSPGWGSDVIRHSKEVQGDVSKGEIRRECRD